MSQPEEGARAGAFPQSTAEALRKSLTTTRGEANVADGLFALAESLERGLTTVAKSLEALNHTIKTAAAQDAKKEHAA